MQKVDLSSSARVRRHPGVPPPQGRRGGRNPRQQECVPSVCPSSLTSTNAPHAPPAAQEEREYAIKAFKTGKKDVMVASGVASKGLDFSEIQHVINFSMPKEIEVRPPASPLTPSARKSG